MEEPRAAQATPQVSNPPSTDQTLPSAPSIMEEPRAAQATPQVSNSPSTGQTLPSQSPPPPPESFPSQSKKRPNECDAHLQNSNYFKIRAVIKDLRPRFLEVIGTPDFRNCKASHEIQEQLKILVDLCKHMGADVASLGKSKNVQDGQPSSGENLNGKAVQEQPQHVKTQQQSQIDRVIGRPSESKLTSPLVGQYKQPIEDVQSRGTYVVGGSAFGWNFITFSGNEPVYYGVTKEQFRSGK